MKKIIVFSTILATGLLVCVGFLHRLPDVYAANSPSVFFSAIPDNSEIYGNSYAVDASSTPNDGGSIVTSDLQVNGSPTQTLTVSPLDFSLNTLEYSDGTYNLSINSTDDQNDTSTATTSVFISNGDLSGAGHVNLSDLAIMASNWGMSSGATYAKGDITGDGSINIADLAILAANWGWSAGTTPVTNYDSGVPAGITPGSAFENTFRSLSSEQQNAVISQMTADGVRWLRLDVTSTFSSDAFIQDATAGGIHVDAILQNGGLSNTPSAIASFASDAVAHLKPEGVETYEVLNEPNGCGDTETASGYAAILKSTYIAIKTADPNAFVLSGGLCPNSGANEPYTYLTSMYADGVQGYFDGFNMHPYSFPDTPLQVTDGWNPWSYLSELYSIMSSNGDGNKKIWLTEFGCPTGTDGGYPADCTDATLAQQITDAFTSARAGAYVGPLLIYNWEDDSVTQDGDFGLYTSSGSAKPDTLAAYMSEAAG